MMRKYFDSLQIPPICKIAISDMVLMCTAFIPVLLYPAYDLLLVFWGPIFEESLKFLSLISLMALFRLKGCLDSTWKCEFLVLILLTILVGISFSFFEHQFRYPQEHLYDSCFRFFAHPAYTLLGITMALRLWEGGWKPTRGFLGGLGSAAVLHSLFNSLGHFGLTANYQLFASWICLGVIFLLLRPMRHWTHIPDGWKQASTIPFKVKSEKPK
ncbi:MAG: PrsW family glutamic-type intramembrane protease [Methanocellales archaeon]|nr:PrsW family glutamic-type intramembrane protease [Methanocellales archaeon]